MNKPDCMGNCPITGTKCESSGCGNGCIETINQFHDDLLIHDNTAKTPLMVANDFIIKLMRERDEARRIAEAYARGNNDFLPWNWDRLDTDHEYCALPWEKPDAETT